MPRTIVRTYPSHREIVCNTVTASYEPSNLGFDGCLEKIMYTKDAIHKTLPQVK